MDEIAKTAGVQVEYLVKNDWNAVEASLTEGEADLIPNMGVTPGRLERMAFTAPVGTFPISMFVRTDSDGTYHKAGTVESNAATGVLKDRESLKLEIFPSIERALFELLAGHVDAVAYPEPVTWHVARKAGISDHIRVTGGPISEIKRAIAVRKADERLAELLDPSVHKVVASRRYKEIFDKWYGTPSPFWTPRRLAWAAGGMILLFGALMLAWRHFSVVAVNRDLRRTMAEREKAEKELRQLAEELEQRVDQRTEELQMRETAANLAQTQLRQVFDTAPIPMILADTDQGQILLANRAAQETFGLGAEEQGKRCSGDLCMDEGERESLAARLALEERIDTLDLRMRAADDTELWTLASFRRVVFDGRPAILGAFQDITSRKAAEDELRKLSLAVEKSPAVVVITDEEGFIEYVNPRFTEVTGYTADEVIGRSPRIVSSGNMDSGDYAGMWQTIKSGNIWHGEFENRRKDGSTYWVSASIAPIRNASGTITHFVSVQEDVTKLRKTAEALRISEERFHNALTFANIGAWDWNIGSGDLYWSEQIPPLFGYPTGELETSYENFISAVHPDDRAPLEERVRACIEDGIEYDFEHRVVWPDGTVRWVLERGDVVRDDEGGPVHMLGVVHDITARRMAEEAVKKSEERLTTAIANISEGFALFDSEDRLIRCNTQYRNIYPLSRNIIRPGATFEEIVRFGAEHGEYADAVGRTDEWLAERMEIRQRDRAMFEQKLANGRWLRATDHRLPNGERVCIRVDITELRMAKEAAEEANRAKSEFLSSMSHELRTPLNAILGFAQLLETGRKEPLSERQKKQVHYILSAGEHLLDLINEVLDLARIEAGRLQLDIGDVNARNLLDECLSLTRSQADSAGITIEDRTTDAPLRTVRADYMRTKQVLLNLLSNAIKYNKENGTVRIEAEAREEWLRISVSDNGIGIPVSRQEEIFMPFHRLGAESTDIQGTGIGLTITKQLVESMDGTIGFESRQDEGSTFWFDLPLADD